MPRERIGFRENLQDILEFFDGKRMLSVGDVLNYTGFLDRRTVNKHFPFTNGHISAVTLAMCLAGGERE